MQLIVTGFEKFADFDYNPSQQAVEALPDKLSLANGRQAVPVSRLVFKSCCEDSWAELSAKLGGQFGTPTVVIMTGLASRRDRISLERFALNIKDYRIPDNQGHQPQDGPIDPNGPEAIRTRLPLPAICERLNDMDHLCEVSNHAGTFLCNEIYYRSLRAGQVSGQPVTSLFVHLPLPEAYDAASRDQPDAPAELTEEQRQEIIAIYASALTEIARLACEWLVIQHETVSIR